MGGTLGRFVLVLGAQGQPRGESDLQLRMQRETRSVREEGGQKQLCVRSPEGPVGRGQDGPGRCPGLQAPLLIVAGSL